MSLWAIIPVKPLKNAKSRLSDILTPEQRYQLAQALFHHVLSVAASVQQITGVMVISRDTKALAIAREMGAKTIQESADSDLNPALLRATAVVRSWRADAVFILPADLPFVHADDVRAMIRLSQERSVVIASDRRADGTNALLVRPPGLIEYEYGQASFQKHVASAGRVGAVVASYHSDRLALDIDFPQDLESYQHILAHGRFGHLPAFPLQFTKGVEAFE